MSFKDKYEDLKNKGQQKLEENFWRSIILSAQSLLPDEFAEAVGEYTDPKNIEPMLFTLFKLLIRNLDIPPGEFRIVIGYNDVAECMSYGVEVVNVHEKERIQAKATYENWKPDRIASVMKAEAWKKVEFPMSVFMGNVFVSEKRQATASMMKQSILYMRFFKRNTDGTRGGNVLSLGGEVLQLNALNL